MEKAVLVMITAVFSILLISYNGTSDLNSFLVETFIPAFFTTMVFVTIVSFIYVVLSSALRLEDSVIYNTVVGIVMAIFALTITVFFSVTYSFMVEHWVALTNTIALMLLFYIIGRSSSKNKIKEEPESVVSKYTYFESVRQKIQYKLRNGLVVYSDRQLRPKELNYLDEQTMTILSRDWIGSLATVGTCRLSFAEICISNDKISFGNSVPEKIGVVFNKLKRTGHAE